MNHEHLKKSKARKVIRKTRKLHTFIKCGDLSQARSLIENLSQEERRKLTKPFKRFGIKPAIFVAIAQSKLKFVQFLVNECNANVEEQLRDKKSAEYQRFAYKKSPGLSPLDFAISMHEYAIVEFLLSVGGEASKLAKNLETIFVACRTKSLRILQILAEHGADFNVSDRFRRTCLMVVTDDVRICRFLLDMGVDMNRKNNNGDTALHVAVTANHFDSVSLLLDRGIDINCKNNNYETAFHIAAKQNLWQLANLLLHRRAGEFTKDEDHDDDLLQLYKYFPEDALNNYMNTTYMYKEVERFIESLQLLGSCFLLYHDNITNALTAWKRAIDISVENRIRIIPSKLVTPVGVAIEATSYSELDALSRDQDGLYMQSIVLMHDILGPNHTEFLDSVASIAIRCFKTGSFDKCLQMLLYYFRLIQDSDLNPSRKSFVIELLVNGILRYVEDFGKVKPLFSFNLVYEFMETIAQALPKCIKAKEENAFLKLIVLVMMLFISVQCEHHQKLEFQRLVRHTMMTLRRKKCRRTLLMSALRFWNRITTDNLNWHLGVVDMLLSCEENINEVDQNGNNVVHILYKHRRKYDGNCSSQIAARFVEYGIHLDARNRKGIEAAGCLRELGIRSTPPPINLMCVAAKGIKKYKISVKGILPKIFRDFIEMH